MILLPKFIDDAAGPPAKSVGNTLANVWDLAIGNHVSLWIKKQEVRQKQNLKDYVQKVEEKTQNIPEEFIKEPDLHIVGPALEASKYYIDSEELREMFANLVAASIDLRKDKEIHPSFVEIIKQLSPLDATILKERKDFNRLPIAQLRAIKEDGSFITTHNHIMNFKDQNNYKQQVSSLSNLQRLGLLDINYTVHSSNPTNYEYVEKHVAYFEAMEKLSEFQEIESTFKNVDIGRGLCYVTPLCEDFISVCL